MGNLCCCCPSSTNEDEEDESKRKDLHGPLSSRLPDNTVKAEKSKPTYGYLFNELPDDLYLLIMTKYGLSVQDIENVGKSGIDSRTELAFDKLEHAIIRNYEFGLSSKEFKAIDLSPFLAKLPKTIKSIVLFEGSFMCRLKPGTIKSFAERCPNVEYLQVFHHDDYLEYINTVGLQHKLKRLSLLTLISREGYDAILEVIRSSQWLEQLAITLKPSAIEKGLLDVIKERSTLKKLRLLIYFTPNFNTRQKLTDMITSLPSLQKLILEPIKNLDSSFILFSVEQNFKTELDLQYSLMIDINEIPMQAKDSVTTIGLRSESLNDFNNFPNLRELNVWLAQNETIPERLCDLQMASKVTVKLTGFEFSSLTKKSFDKFMEVNGHRLKWLKVNIVEEVSQFVKILARASNLDLVKIDFNGESDDTISIDDVKTMYQIPVKNLIRIRSNSDLKRETILRVVIETSHIVSDKKCLISPIMSGNRAPIEVEEENDDG